MRVIIGSGKVASIIWKPGDIVLTHADIDVTDPVSVSVALSDFPVGVPVINTAAKINLEWCEENRLEAEAVNFHGAVNVANKCALFGLHLIHISSGCIFDGMETGHIYTEEDEPSPAAWYTVTKSAADKELMNIRKSHEAITIVRPRQLISAVPNPTNMLTKFATMQSGKFIDSPNSITCIEDMGDMIDHLIENKLYGIYNLANEGFLTPYEIAKMVSEKLNPSMKVESVSYSDYISNLSVKRVNTLLDISKLKSIGFTPRNAVNALTWCLDNYGKTR